MFAKLFERKPAPQTTFILARINDRALPIDRGELYEDPLMEVLEQHGAGTVVGGGSQLSPEMEIVFCDIEIEVPAATSEVISLIQRTLEDLGAPKGSLLRLEAAEEELPFGVNEGLAVYLNGTDLPDEVYEECDTNFVYSEFNRLLGDEGKIHSHWQGPTETALYMYGPSYQTMYTRLADFLATYPLCQRARIEQIA
jgi:hypothetical protein